MSWAQSHGKTYGPTWVCKQLNVSQTSEIKDIPTAVSTLKAITEWADN